MSNHRIKKISQRQEKRAAKDIGGRTVAGSGAAKFSGGGDVRKVGEIRVECKYTEKPSYSLKYADLAKLNRQAIQGGLETPVFLIEFLSPPGAYAITRSPVAMSEWECMLMTPKKSMTLHRNVIEQSFLEHGDEVYIAFKVKAGPTKVWEYYRIQRWGDFLKTMEQLNARDSDN